MCRGREEGERKQDYLSEDECLTDEVCLCKDDHDHDHHGSKFSPSSSISCELCDSEASVYCQADDAFLCEKCDTRVHAANFLAQRHIRCFLCTNCHSLTHRYLIGLSVQVQLPTILCKKENIENHSNDESDVVDPNSSNQLIRPFLFL
ncbi:B-box domain protein 30 [Heracleum sosnowskyi]|uniref:B-box domain protein 30 n=1 Tax=Heracleum sosnowskyi TaxID=360622 RepID=A0AAD8GR16_9APIA|nr:B-box domain protein 30 [Heracleum sosnowskyi]